MANVSPYAEGATATNPQTGQKAVFKGGQWVVLGTPQMQQGATAMSEADKKALTDMNADLLQKQELARRANQFMSMQKQGNGVATGPGYGDMSIPFPFMEHGIPLGAPGQMLRTVVDGLTGDNQAERLKAMQGVSNQTWVELRPQGSGPIRGYEAEGFKQAFPNIANWGTANQDITTRMNNEANDAARRVAFVNQFVNQGKGGVADALAAYGTKQTPMQATLPKGQPPQGGGQVFHYDAQGNRR
jgi:hypothetical protein